MPGGSMVSFSGVDTCLSSLKNCQSYINTGMEITTSITLDLIQNHHDMAEVNEMEKVILEFASMNRDVSQYMQAVQDTVNQIKQDKPDIVPDLNDLVQENFTALKSTNSDLDLQRNEKFVLFQEQVKQMKTQFGVQSEREEGEAFEQVDEDIAVSQSQKKFICPITQEEMKKPVQNKVCGHHYEEEAILKMIQHKVSCNKKARCPLVGCNNLEVKRADLVPAEVLKRAIESQNRRSRSTQ